MRFSTGIFILLLVSGCSSPGTPKQDHQNEQHQIRDTQIEFNANMHDFGTLQAGETVAYSFLFTNTGNDNLLINNAESDCGCIKVNYPKDPIKPGESGYIEVEFNTAGLFGKNFKAITVHANVKEPKHLAIFAEVNNEQLKIQY